MSQSKISKIETGFYTQLIPSEIEVILNILDAPKTISQQVIQSIVDGNQQYTTRKVTPRWSAASKVFERERETRLLRNFTFQHVPAILQTVEYRNALMGHYDEDDTNYSVIMKRQDLVWDGNHRYHIILHEASLYTIFSAHRVHIAQLDRLERFIGAEYVKLGIIPLEAGLIPFENSVFVLYDERLVVAVIGSNEIELDSPLDIAEHVSMFKALEKKAEYDDGARRLIHKAVNYFNLQ
jgi:hypothetical protein